MAVADTTIETVGVSIPRADLAAALRVAASIKARDVHLDLDGEVATLHAYTPEVAVTVALNVPVDEPAGVVGLSRVALAAVLPYCGSTVALTVEEHSVALVSDGTTFELRTLREDAVKHPATIKGEEFKFDAPTLVEVLRRSLPFVSTDETRPVLTGLALYPRQNLAVATDSYRLAIVRYAGDSDEKAHKDEEPVVIYRVAAQSIKRLLSKKLGQVTVRQGDTHIAVEFDGIKWSIRRVVKNEGAFPQWRKLLPGDKAGAVLKVDRDDLLHAARAASALGSSQAPLRLKLANGEATVRSARLDHGQMECRLASAEITGAVDEIALNPHFLADIAATAPVERLTISMLAPLRPILVTAARDEYLLMPVRLNV